MRLMNTPHPSPLTSHPSPLTPHPLPLTTHHSPLTPHPSPLIQNTAVYWGYRKGIHSDIRTEGYVGVSRRPEIRYKEHRRSKKNPYLYRALMKHPDIIFKIHCWATNKEAYQLEFHLRPTRRIGWNIAPGGGSPPNQITWEYISK